MASSGGFLSQSEKLRRQGNELYRQAADGRFCSTIRHSRMERAHHFYTQSLHASTSAEEKAASSKNLGLLHKLWCHSELRQHLPVNGFASLPTSSSSFPSLKYHISQCIKHLLQAKDYGTDVKPHSWLAQIDLTLTDFILWASVESCHSPLLQCICQAFDKAYLLSVSLAHRPMLLAFKSYVHSLFKHTLLLKQANQSLDYRGTNSFLQDCLMYLRKAAEMGVQTDDEESLQEEVESLRESVEVHLCICEAMRDIELGDRELEIGVRGEEEMEMEKVKDALDYYRQAAIATREKDMESEAMAMSRIGGVYREVMMVEEMGHKYDMQAVRLAHTVMAPNIQRAEWYKKSLERVKKHQERVMAEEEAQRERDRLPAMERQQEKMKLLQQEGAKSAQSFLQFLYQTHPHPELKRNRALPSMQDRTKVKAAMKKALLLYHPDTNVKFGEDWKVLCEEICKLLTHKYECFK